VTINFEPATAPVPTGDQADTGAVYTASRGYGWSADLTGNARARNTNADQRLDTFVYSSNVATWTGDLANGNYLVSLASGDAAWAQGPHRVVVEGVVAVNDVSTAVNQYVTVTDLPVTVADGKLTVQIGGAGGNTMLNYLRIRPATSTPQVLSSIDVSPATTSVVVGATQQLTAIGKDASGAAMATQPTFAWSVSGGGSISSSGLFTAGSTAGGPFTVTATSGTITGKASVTVASSSSSIAKINFQPNGSPTPTDYTVDDGSPYSASRGFGWGASLVGSTRDRDVNADQRLDTFVFSSTLATWNYSLPNGNYWISLASGDASYGQGPHRVVVEGVPAISDVSTAANQYITITNLPVTVTDGQLTVQIGGSGGNSMLNYIEIVAKGTCTPTTCGALGKTCGSVPDGCGGTLDCGTCGGSYTTSFSLNESVISEGGKWVNGKAVGLSWHDIGTSGGTAIATHRMSIAPPYDDCVAHLSSAFLSFNANQYAQGTVYRAPGYTSGHEIELLLRFEITANSARGYEIYWSTNGGLYIVRWNGPINSFNSLYVASAGLANDGDVVRAEITGSTITVRINGSVVLSGTDSAWTSGQPGIGLNPWGTDSDFTSYTWKDFAAGNL
jgi:hypothetical protein